MTADDSRDVETDQQRRKRDRMLILLALLLAPYMVSLQSMRRIELGIENGRLRVCPPSPSCVCTEFDGVPSFAEALAYRGDAEAAWNRLKSVIQAMPRATILEERSGYLHVEFSSLIYGFREDVEFRLVPFWSRIHVRAAARIGYSDFGASRRRLEEIRTRFERPDQ